MIVTILLNLGSLRFTVSDSHILLGQTNEEVKEKNQYKHNRALAPFVLGPLITMSEIHKHIKEILCSIISVTVERIQH